METDPPAPLSALLIGIDGYPNAPLNGCVNGLCACTTGLTRCNNTCVDTRFDENNCGMCGNVCPSNQQCSNSACAPP